MRSIRPRVSHTYAAQPEFAAAARAAIEEYLHELDLDEDRRFAITYATGEALANAIEHGSSQPGQNFNLHIEQLGGHLRIQIENVGTWRSFEPNEERGRGIPIMQSLADNVNIVSNGRGTIVHLSFRI